MGKVHTSRHSWERPATTSGMNADIRLLVLDQRLERALDPRCFLLPCALLCRAGQNLGLHLSRQYPIDQAAFHTLL